MGRPLELIMARQWMALLTTPSLLFGEDGTLVFFNDAAAVILGRSFSECGTLTPTEWQAALRVEGELHIDAPEASLLGRALESNTAIHRTIMLRAMDGARRQVNVTTFPIRGVGQPGMTGVMALLDPVG
ncbi:MAG: hypothetical protein GY913_33410 [Proteobacteria bacterium]|nr:hypothetical protein [Pseudomonadota bacterium]MCP4921825.1 hypothetical protein [Pseudomonadota bacterium]